MEPRRPPVVELELQPHWWTRLTKNLSPNHPSIARLRELHASAVAEAQTLGTTVDLITTRHKFVVRVFPTADTTLEQLCAKAGEVIDRLNALPQAQGLQSDGTWL